MSRRFFPLLVAAAIPALFGCDADSVGPDVGPSSLTVQAYVDADGSGSFDAGDTPLAGETIHLTGPAGATASATTDADGVATFDDLGPGSYELTFEGAVPAGATLAGASNPVVVVQTVSQELETEFRFVSFPGDIEGVLYRDENANDVFDEGDTPAPGIPVAVYAGTTVEGEALAETTTDDQGGYRFEDLRPGTYTVAFSPFPTMELEGGGTITVEVGADATTTRPVEFTGSLLSPIADARAMAAGDGGIVAVEGVVTWQPSYADELFIQDATGGIQVYARDADVRNLGLVPGDTVIVVGDTEERFGEAQITGVSALLLQGTGDAPAPQPTSATELNAGTVQHELVTIEGATVDSVHVVDDFGNQFVFLTDAAGNQFGVYADSRTGVDSTTWGVGGVYSVTGVAGFDSRFAYPERIEVRGPEDVVPAEAPLTIAEVKAAELGSLVLVSGTVIAQPSFSDELFIQDATGGIQIYAGDVSVRDMGLEPGDVVLVSGTTEERFGELQITSVTSLTVIGTGAAPDPVLVTPAEIVSGSLIHQLVTVADATVLEVDTSFNTFGNQVVRLQAPNGEEFAVYVDSRTGVTADDWTVGGVYDVTGVINYDSRRLFDYQIWVRGAGDVVAN